MNFCVLSSQSISYFFLLRSSCIAFTSTFNSWCPFSYKYPLPFNGFFLNQRTLLKITFLFCRFQGNSFLRGHRTGPFLWNCLNFWISVARCLLNAFRPFCNGELISSFSPEEYKLIKIRNRPLFPHSKTVLFIPFFLCRNVLFYNFWTRRFVFYYDSISRLVVMILQTGLVYKQIC